ncbi:alanine aminotransferase 1 [Salmo salar]|uniref:alanine transaminase n=1 Tax=Salmo salar TaxID=8030 RepID=A0ABM3CU82_SALSA|nr:alanine aminotransferase 1-like [Salmo salar]
MTSGSQRSLMLVLKMLVHNQASLLTGVLTAVPAYSYFKMMLQRLGTTVVPYYLDEEQGWAMEVEELRRALQASKGVCNPVALYVINPGNPTGHVQSRKCIEEVIRFAAKERLMRCIRKVCSGRAVSLSPIRRFCLR